jgi:hypothetical protein
VQLAGGQGLQDQQVERALQEGRGRVCHGIALRQVRLKPDTTYPATVGHYVQTFYMKVIVGWFL